MSFISKKKKYKFQVEFEVDELSNVPFVSGTLFTKVRLVDGGSFTECTNSAEVVGHSVQWKACFKFCCKMVSNVTSGVLEPCFCRVSVRKEMKGGKSYQKLGFADVNLAQFAGAGKSVHRYLLDGYNTKRRREDNSTLKISVHLIMLQGDPCFKVPNPVPEQLVGDGALHEGNRVRNASRDGEGTPSTSSGLTAIEWNVELKDPSDGAALEDLVAVGEKDMLPAPGHSRNPSSISSQSKMSAMVGSHVSSHSRQPSTDSSQSKVRTNTCGSADIGLLGSLRKRHKILDDSALDVVDGLLRTAGFNTLDDATDEASGLFLAVTKDGTTVLQTVKSVTSCQNSTTNTLR